MRLLILLHRYIGLFISLVIMLWCLSGFVMMYVQYPEYSREEQLADLEPLDLGACCVLPSDWSEDFPIVEARVESFLGDPVLRLTSGWEDWTIDLVTGQVIDSIDAPLALSIAERHAVSPVSYQELLERDQWTVAGGYNAHRPLYHFAAQDDAGTEFYVSSATGELVLETTRKERFWNWLGSVIHWIYPTELRRNVGAWSQTVIWLSIAGTFLTLTGLYVGIARYRMGAGSPYRGWFLWHHYLGLAFGLFTLTWMVSGLLSMSPFGALSGRDFSIERTNIRGAELSFGSVSLGLDRLDKNLVPAGTVRLSSSMFDGEYAWIAWNADGDSIRSATALTEEHLLANAASARPQEIIKSVGLIDEPDAYYYGHHDERTFPVLRIQYDDGERLYLDSVSGELVSAVDSNRRWSRWLFLALHRGDFATWARQRPVWDVFMLILMTGVTLGSGTGAYLAWKRASRWLRLKI